MPKMIDSELKARAVRLVNEQLGEYPSLTTAAGNCHPRGSIVDAR